MFCRTSNWISDDDDDENDYNEDDDELDEDDDGLDEDDDELDEDDSCTPFVIISSSDDDDEEEEANEDLSLRIVEKSLSLRSRVSHSKEAYASPDLIEISSREFASDVFFNSNEFSSRVAAGSMIKEMNGNLIHKICHRNTPVFEPETPHRFSEGMPSITGDEELVIIDKADEVDADNTVLRKLLRGPRYFDPQDGVWELCVNCGERGHTSGECTSLQNRKKPCFICGSLEHKAKMCFKGKDCFICKSGEHRARDCPEKRQRSSLNSNICLKCGNYGHDMFSCTIDYSLEDLKEIQCYICKDFGHLCCAENPYDGPREVSCYRCGQLGHTGLACRLKVGVQEEVGVGTSTAMIGACFKCGGQGHFAQECTRSSNKRGLSTPLKVGKNSRIRWSGIKSEPPARPGKRDYDNAVTPKNKGGCSDSSKIIGRKKQQQQKQQQEQQKQQQQMRKRQNVGTPPPTIRGVQPWSPNNGRVRHGYGGEGSLPRFPGRSYTDLSGKHSRFGNGSAPGHSGGNWAGPNWAGPGPMGRWAGGNGPPPHWRQPPPPSAPYDFQPWWHPDGFVRRGFIQRW